MTDTLIFSATDKVPMTKQKTFARRDQAPRLALETNPHYLQVMAWLLKLRFMTTEQLGRILDPPRGENAAYKLLRRMYDAGLTARVEAPVKKPWGEGPVQPYGSHKILHCPDRKGRDFYAKMMELAKGEVDWYPRDNQKLGPPDHRLATNDILIAMHHGARRQGFQFEIVQSEHQIHKTKKPPGHDFVADPRTGKNKPVKADAVCRLKLFPTDKTPWLSLECDMGTEGEEQIKQKFRLHRHYFASGGYHQRHGTWSNRVPFVVADVRNPYITSRPLTEADWRERVGQRADQLKTWAEEEGMAGQFWFTPIFALTEESVWHRPIWRKAWLPDPQKGQTEADRDTLDQPVAFIELKDLQGESNGQTTG